MLMADDFLEKMMPEFGLNGTNNLPTGDAIDTLPFCQLAADRVISGFMYGYDGRATTFRGSRSSIYWTEYLPLRTTRHSFLEELDNFLLQVAGEFGKISVSGTAGALSCLLLRRAVHLGLDVQQKLVVVSGHAWPKAHGDVPTKVKEVSLADVDEFAVKFLCETHCCDPWIAFEAMHGGDDGRFHLFTNAIWTLIDFGYDARRSSFVGPPTWVIHDSEMDTAIDRWCRIHGVPGTDCVLRGTAGLIGSQFGSAQFSEWLQMRSAHRSPPSQEQLNYNSWLVGLMRSYDPSLPSVVRARYAHPDDDALQVNMRDLRKRLRKLMRVRESSHTTPLWHLFGRMNLTLPRDLDSRSLYGDS